MKYKKIIWIFVSFFLLLISVYSALAKTCYDHYENYGEAESRVEICGEMTKLGDTYYIKVECVNQMWESNLDKLYINCDKCKKDGCRGEFVGDIYYYELKPEHSFKNINFCCWNKHIAENGDWAWASIKAWWFVDWAITTSTSTSTTTSTTDELVLNQITTTTIIDVPKLENRIDIFLQKIVNFFKQLFSNLFDTRNIGSFKKVEGGGDAKI